MKVVVNSQNDKVVGIHLVGAEVAEILQVTFSTCLSGDKKLPEFAMSFLYFLLTILWRLACHRDIL